MTVHFHNIQVEVTQGDIVRQPDCEAIVNAANAQLRIGGGVAGAIHRIGDPKLTEETRKYAPISPGEAVLTSAPNLPNNYVIHCLGPVYGRDKPEEQLLRNCYENALRVADENGIRSVAFPAISTGAFGYPVRPAARTALTTIRNISPELNSVEQVRFVLWSKDDYRIHKEVLNEIKDDNSA